MNNYSMKEHIVGSGAIDHDCLIMIIRSMVFLTNNLFFLMCISTLSQQIA